MLNPFLAVTDIPLVLGEGLAALNLGKYGTLIAILSTYMVLGMFLYGLAMLVVIVCLILIILFFTNCAFYTQFNVWIECSILPTSGIVAT